MASYTFNQRHRDCAASRLVESLQHSFSYQSSNFDLRRCNGDIKGRKLIVPATFDEVKVTTVIEFVDPKKAGSKPCSNKTEKAWMNRHSKEIVKHNYEPFAHQAMNYTFLRDSVLEKLYIQKKTGKHLVVYIPQDHVHATNVDSVINDVFHYIGERQCSGETETSDGVMFYRAIRSCTSTEDFPRDFTKYYESYKELNKSQIPKPPPQKKKSRDIDPEVYIPSLGIKIDMMEALE